MARKSRGCAEAYKNSTLRGVRQKIDAAKAEKDPFRMETSLCGQQERHQSPAFEAVL